jgi:glycine cleavage system H protein
MPAPADRNYTKTHEWLKIEGDTATIGISDFAVKAIKDIVFLELPSLGTELQPGKPFGVIESVKAVFDLNAPLAGKVTAVNSAMQDDFETLAKDPFGKGWLIKLSPASGASPHLMDAAAYDLFCAQEQH